MITNYELRFYNGKWGHNPTRTAIDASLRKVARQARLEPLKIISYQPESEEECLLVQIDAGVVLDTYWMDDVLVGHLIFETLQVDLDPEYESMIEVELLHTLFV